MAKGQKERRDQFPRVITCPNEVCSYVPAESAIDGLLVLMEANPALFPSR